MKRRGFLLLEGLLALALSACLAAAVFPGAAHLVGAAAHTEERLRADEESLAAVLYIADGIRWSLARTDPADGGRTGNRYTFSALSESGKEEEYTFAAEDGQWQLILYNGRSQPITGGSASSGTAEEGSAPYFTVYPEGLAVVDFRLVMPGSGASREIRTAVLPLSDYFLMGEPFR